MALGGTHYEPSSTNSESSSDSNSSESVRMHLLLISECKSRWHFCLVFLRYYGLSELSKLVAVHTK